MNKCINTIQTHLEIESGTSLRVTSKPPVNCKLKDLAFSGSTTQDGIPTPAEPVQMLSVPQSFDTTSCGGNWFDTNKDVLYSNGTTKITISNGIRSICASTSLNLFVLIPFLNGSFCSEKIISFKCSFVPSALNKGRYAIGYSDLNGNNRVTLATSYFSNFVLTVTYPVLVNKIPAIWFYSNGDGIAEIGDYVDYTNINIVQGSFTALTMPPYRPYTGLTQTFNLLSANCTGYDNFDSFPATGTVGQQVKDNSNGLLYDWNGSNYQPTELRSLPDGTADTVSSKTGKRNIEVARWQNINRSWSGASANEPVTLSNINTYKAFRCSRVLPNCVSSSYTNDILSNMFTVGTTFLDGFKPHRMWRYTTNVYCGVALADIGYAGVEVTSENFNAVASSAVAFMNDLTDAYFDYELATPIITDIDMVELAKMKAQTQYQYETNVNTNATPQPIITAEVRKLGNRAYTVQDYYLANGNTLLIDYLDLNNIVDLWGGLIVTNKTYNTISVLQGPSSGIVFIGFSLNAGTYTFTRTFNVTSGGDAYTGSLQIMYSDYTLFEPFSTAFRPDETTKEFTVTEYSDLLIEIIIVANTTVDFNISIQANLKITK